MNIGSVSQTGIAAIQRGSAKLNRATHAIANASVRSNSDENNIVGGTKPSLVESLASTKQATLEIQMGVRIVEVSDEILGTLLDVTA